jgi:hypothetical protein
LPENATGNVTVIIDGNATVVPLVNGSAQINVSDLAPGSHSITIEYPGDENCAQFAKTVDVLIAPNQVSPELSIAPVSDVEEGNPVTISISALANFTGTVKVLVGSVEIGNATVSDGIGSYAIAADKLAVGANTVYVTSEDSVDFSADRANVTFTVTRKPVDPALTVKVADITEGANAVIVITTNATFSGNVKVQIAGSNLTVAVTNGSGSIPVSGLAVGTYTAVATFDATDVFTASTKNATFAVKAKVATSIKATAVKTTYGTSKKITITLTDANGKALANKKVIVELKGAKKELTTDGKGQASYAIGTKLAPKKYTAKITFAGDSSYVKSTGSAKVTVNKAKPKLTAKKKSFKVKKAKKYTITLKTDKKKALKKSKVTLTVKVKGKKVKITKKTNAKGKATFNLKKLNKKGKYTATVKFAGNKNYKAATKKVKITIK